MGVYSGTTVNSLPPTLGKHDDVGIDDLTSRVFFNAAAGTVYRIAVDGYNNGSSGGDFGSLKLNWAATNCATGPAPEIMLDQSGPAADQAAAFDSILHLRDPFLVLNPANLLGPAADRNTRVVIFVTNLSLSPGEPASSVTVNLVDSNSQSHNLAAEDVRPAPNTDFTQVTFRLPAGLPAGTCTIKLTRNTLMSNTATIRIRI
jgi:hypothetical protein